jgi:hypothetical protein
MQSVVVFISSREHELAPEREIAAETITKMGMSPWRLDEDGAPQSNRDPRHSYLPAVESCHLFVLLLWKEYSAAVKAEFDLAKRAGKDVLCLVKNIVDPERPDAEIREFITHVKKSGCTTKSFRTLQELRAHIVQGLVLAFRKRLESPFQASGKEKLFNTGTKLVEQSQQRVILVARTPIPLVGTRPYDKPRAHFGYEKEQFDAFENLISDAASGKGKAFTLVASLSAMSSLIAENADKHTFQAWVRNRIIDLGQKSAPSSSRLELLWINKNNPHPLTFLVADDSFLIWMKDEQDDVWITWMNEPIARALEFSSRQLAGKFNINKVMAELGFD